MNIHHRHGAGTLLALSLFAISGVCAAQNGAIDVLKPFAGSGSQNNLAVAIGTLCPAGNRVTERLQQDCNALIGQAFAGGEGVRDALGQIVPDNANIPIDRTQLMQLLGSNQGRAGAMGIMLGSTQVADSGLLRFVPGMAGGTLTTARRFDRWTLFASFAFKNFERQASANEDGFAADRRALQLGFHRRIGERVSVGLLLGVGRGDMDFTAQSGQQDQDDRQVVGMLDWHIADGWTLDALASWRQRSVDQVRRVAYTLGSGVAVDQRFASDYDADNSAVAASLGRHWQRGSMGIVPYVGIEWSSINVDGYAERASDPTASGGGWAIVAPEVDSDLTNATLGARINWALGHDNGVWLPQLDVAWVHVLDHDEVSAAVRFDGDLSPSQQLSIQRFAMINDPTDDAYLRLGLSVVGQWAGGRSGFVSVGGHLADGDYSQTRVTLGFNWEF